MWVQRNTKFEVPALALLSLMCLVGAAAPAFAGQFTGEVNFLLGRKYLDSSDWQPLDDQGEFGAETSWSSTDWPVHIAGDLLVSADTQEQYGLDIVGSTAEFAGGVRKIWRYKSFHPYVGGGIAVITAYAKDERRMYDDDDANAAVGFWGGGGAFWRLGPHFNIGFALRVSQAELTLFGRDVEAGGFHAAMILGFGWPARK